MPHLFYLIGPPASGKRTIGQLLERQTGAVLLDNHLWSDPIFRACGVTGHHELPAGLSPLREQVRLAVLQAAELAPAQVSHIFTHYLTAEAREQETFGSLAALAKARGAVFTPVVLTCQREELARRINRPERQDRLKLKNPALLASLLDTRGTFTAPADVPVLDTTSLEPEAAARQVAALAGLLASADLPSSGRHIC
ncbi:ATP-binding protein (plasmid) [Deinococcus taeanensis]|uniref:AAA family ATPase n=1 Tax=Deinococcus taeanensis TaxID=2737050 RepID=UPI001CDD8B97|nr:ATP-binding protein [Deinococcus taeanensis]UBV44733.1 ATP-binding protein [Deinococcus taeanensis]